VAESTRSQYVEEAERFGEADLLRLLTVAGDAQDEVKNSPQPRLKLETTLLKMAQMRRTADLREVLQKIDRLEQMAEAGEIPESLAGAGTSTPEEAPESEATERQTEEATPEAAEPTPSYASEAPGETASPADAESPPAAPTATEPEDADEEEAPPADEEMPPTDETEDEAEDRDPDSEDSGSDGGAPADPGAEEADDSSVEYNDLFGTPALDGGSDAGGDGASDTSTDAQGDRSSSDGGGGPQAAVAEPAVESATTGAEGLAQRWPQFVQAVKGERISLGSLLGETEPVELRNEVLTVAVPKPLHRDTLRDQRRFLLGQLTATFEVAIEDMEFVVEEAESDPEDATDGTDPVSPREQLQQLRDTYPSLDVLFGEFGAEPVW
jgi:DNA polymerase-3 subunit gamma/tau